MTLSSDKFMVLATQLAAQAWCTEKTSSIEMDVRLAEAFARQLAGWMANYEDVLADLHRANAKIVELTAELDLHKDDLK